jgi:hypothetical protein
MNQRPQAFPTHCPDSSQHHNPPDYQEVGQPATGATAEAELPPTRAAPECEQPERSHTPRKHAAATVRNLHGMMLQCCPSQILQSWNNV